MGKMKAKVLSCLVVGMLLMSMVPVFVMAQDISNGIAESKHIQESSAAEEFKSQVSKALLASETIIGVQFKAQFPPGTWSATNNCGQASSLMIFCYYKGTTPTEQGIKDIDDWLYNKYGDPINNYNGSITSTTKLEALAREYAGFPGSYKAGGWDLNRLKQEINAGHPVVVAVTAGYLSNRGYSYSGGHFLVAKGYNSTHIICNDPGTSQGENKYYINSEFSDAMSAQGGSVMVVIPTNTIAAVSTYNTILDDLDELVSNGKIPGYDLYTDSNIDDLWVNLDQYKTLLIDEDCIFEWTNPCNPDCNKPIPTTTVGVSFYNHKAQLKQWIFNGGGFFCTDQNDVSPDYLHNVWWTWLPDELQVESNEFPSDYPDIGYGHYPYNLEVIYDPGIFSYPNLIDITKVAKSECHGHFTDFESHGYIALVQDKSDNDVLEVYRTYGLGFVVLSHVEYETAHPWDVDYIENEIHFVASVVEETKIVGNVTNATDYPLENVDMYLYDAKDRWEVLNFIISWFFDPATPVPPYIAHTKTNSTGNYNFTALTPGSYLVLAVPQFDTGYQPKASDVRAVAKDETEIVNLQLEHIRYLAMLDDDMIKLYENSFDLIDKNTHAVAEVNARAYYDLELDSVVSSEDIVWTSLDVLVSGINCVMTGGTSCANEVLKSVVIPAGKETYEELLEGYFKGIGQEGAINAEQEIACLKDTGALDKGTGWIREFKHKGDEAGALNAFRNEKCYKDAVDNLDDTWGAYDTYPTGTAYKQPDPDFRIDEAEKVFEQQAAMLDQSAIGFVAYLTKGLILTPTQNVHTTLDTVSFRDQYMFLVGNKEVTGGATKVASTLAVTSTGIGLVCIATCIPTAGGGCVASTPFFAFSGAMGIIGTIFTLGEMHVETTMAYTYPLVIIKWPKSIASCADVYSNELEWLNREIVNPTLGKTSGEIVSTDIHSSKIFGISTPLVVANEPKSSLIHTKAYHDNTVIVRSTSLIDKVPSRLIGITFEVKGLSEILKENAPVNTLPSVSDAFMLDMNEQKTENIKYTANFYLTTFFVPHVLITMLMMGAEMEDMHSDVFWVVPSLDLGGILGATVQETLEMNTLMKQPMRSNAYAFSTSNSNSPITLEEWISLVGNCTKIIDTNLGPINDSTQVQYTTNVSITNVTFLMVTLPGSYLNLHAYDEVGRHVGYFPVTDSDQVQIPNATYTGNISNPEIIMIPNASSKNYTIKADATQFTSSSPTPVEVYAIETPVRPAVLGISPVELYPFISPGESKNITMQLAEVGKQVDIEEVTLTPHEFTDVYGNSMPNVTISVSPNNFNIDKGIVTFVNLNLNASENVTLPSVPETRYTGNITINTSNAGEINATLSVLILDTDLSNVKLTFAEPNVTGAHALALDLFAIDETYKPEECSPQSAYMINSTGAGNFTLRFTDIPNANLITVYKIDSSSIPPNQWIELDTTTTTDTVTFTMEVGDPPVVFGSGALPVADANGPYTGVVGESITFSGTGSYDPDGTIVSYEWDLDDDGDFDDATGPAPLKTWYAPYSGNISLKVTDDDGATDIDTTTLTVEEAVDTIPPEVSAEFIPVEVEEDEGLFEINYSATDLYDPDPEIIAVILTPTTLADPELELKVEDEIKIEFNLEDDQLVIKEIKGPDPRALWQDIQELGGLRVDLGQKVFIEIDGETEFKTEEGILKIEGLLPTLKVTATDASGNIGEATAQPVFAPEE